MRGSGSGGFLHAREQSVHPSGGSHLSHRGGSADAGVRSVSRRRAISVRARQRVRPAPPSRESRPATRAVGSAGVAGVHSIWRAGSELSAERGCVPAGVPAAAGICARRAWLRSVRAASGRSVRPCLRRGGARPRSVGGRQPVPGHRSAGCAGPVPHRVSGRTAALGRVPVPNARALSCSSRIVTRVRAPSPSSAWRAWRSWSPCRSCRSCPPWPCASPLSRARSFEGRAQEGASRLLSSAVSRGNR
jgi:hypothetical protein